MARRTKVTLDRGGIRELLSGSDIAAHLRERGAAVASAAQAAAPVKSGAYRNSIRVEVVSRSDRTVVQVGATVSYGLEIEAATGNLARALGSA